MITLADIQNVSKRFGARELFANISFSIGEGERVALIARNGTGKSTLLSIIAGEEPSDSGAVIFKNGLRIGYLRQQPHFNPGDTVLEACFNHRHDEELLLKAKQILTSLNIRNLDQPVGQLSGGQQKRVALANVLILEPDLFIMDEPTNHLDLEMIEWLEGFLRRGSKSLLMVTHDRYFLDNVCNRIIEIADGTIYSYSGNYAYYLEKRQERLEVQEATIAKAKNIYRRELEWMRRQPQARGHKARYREEAFVELEQQARQRIEQRQIRLKNSAVYIGSKIFECQYVSKEWPDTHRVILNNFYYNFARFEKMGIVGGNGTGKTTFLRMLLGEIEPDSGRFDIGQTVRFGYFSQQGMKIEQDKRVIDIVRDIAEYVNLGGGKHLTAGQLLERFLFSRQQQYDYAYKLSGGEQRKLYLCTVLMRDPNFLILDEPTNDLDIPTLQVLEEYLEDFPGCVIIVSHDRYFTDRVVDHLLVFHGEGKIDDFPGNYTQYREWLRMASEKDDAKTKTAAREQDKKDKGKPSQSNNDSTRPRKLTFKEKRELEQSELEIDKLETEKKVIVDALSSGTLPVDDIVKYGKRLPEIESQLEKLTERWMELQEIAEQK